MPTYLSVQYLRALAALAVVWCHAYLELEKLALIDIPDWFNGRSGVDLFFVISGFIIWITTHDDAQGMLGFWYRRLVRILPLYWFFTLVMAGLLLAFPTLFDRPHLDVGHVVRSLLFIPHTDPFKPTETYPLLQVGWTLNYEMFFYVLFGLGLCLRSSLRIVAIVLLLGVLVTTGAVTGRQGALWLTYTDPLLLEFLAGAAIGYIFTSKWRPEAGFGYGLIFLSILAYIGLNQGLTVEPIDWRVLCWGVPAILLVTGAVAVERASGMLRIPGLRQLGDASFAIYLSHPFTLGGLRWGFERLDPSADLGHEVLIGLAFLWSVLVGLAVHYSIELPMIRLLGRCRERLLRLRSSPEDVDPSRWQQAALA